ncbi:MAG: RNA recognition motif domain-containing protein [Chthoniobacterales bacterium]
MNSRHSGQRRRRGGRNRQSSRPRSGDNFHVRREPRKPAGLWDKIKAFFGLAPQTASKPSADGSARRERPRDVSPRPAREPREPRAPREPRKPEAVEVTSPRLYVGNLSYDAAESDLFELFSGVGTVANVEIVTNKHTQRSKGFGFVQMNAISEAKRAVEELHDQEYMGRKLVVSGAKLPAERSIGRDREEAPAPAEDRAEEPAAQG